LVRNRGVPKKQIRKAAKTMVKKEIRKTVAKKAVINGKKTIRKVPALKPAQR
jgi:hypothetical protein